MKKTAAAAAATRIIRCIFCSVLAFGLVACAPAGDSIPSNAQPDASSSESRTEPEISSSGDDTSEPAGYSSAALEPLKWNLNLEPIGADAQGETGAAFDGSSAVFTYSGEGVELAYRIDCSSDAVKGGMIEVFAAINGGAEFTAVTNAGVSYADPEGRTYSPEEYLRISGASMEAGFDGETLILTYTDGASEPHTRVYSFSIKGKTLVIHAQSDNQNGNDGYSGFSSGRCAGLSGYTFKKCVYAEDVPVTVANDSFFISAYPDKARSNATSIESFPASADSGTVHGLTMQYELNSAGERNPLDEHLYVTVSDRFLDCVYLNNAEKSPYRDMLGKYVVYDTWETSSTYSQRRMYNRILCDNGLRDVMLIDHRWQRDGLDISNPAFYPASPMHGSEEEFKEYVSAANEMGWLCALHEDYWFIYPSVSNQYWNIDNVEDYIAQLADGTLRPGWQDTSYANRSDMMAHYASIESQLIMDNYAPTAAFTDVNGGVEPNILNQVTYNATSGVSRTLAQVIDDNISLFQTMKDIYRAPLSSEGAQGERSNGSLYAGYVDALEREITGCHDGCEIMVDYELRYIRPLMANQGMGYPERFQTGITPSNTSLYDFDKYNAASIAYGHTGFIGVQHSASLTEQINTYHMFRALQEQYLDTSAEVEEITYYDMNGAAYTLDEAVLAKYSFDWARLYIRYSNGLEIYLNFSPNRWDVELNGHGYQLDQNAWAAENPSIGFVEYSCIVDGVRADYVDCAQYTYANPRYNTVDFGGGLVTSTVVIENK